MIKETELAVAPIAARVGSMTVGPSGRDVILVERADVFDLIKALLQAYGAT